MIEIFKPMLCWLMDRPTLGLLALRLILGPGYVASTSLGREFMPDLDEGEPPRHADAGDRVITIERHVGRRKGTGLEVAQWVSAIWTIKGGAAVEMRIFLDKREALEAAGLRE